MAEYQNIFTQVQVKGPPEMGMDELENYQVKELKQLEIILGWDIW